MTKHVKGAKLIQMIPPGFGKRIRQHRKLMKMSQADVARELGVGQQLINKIEHELVRSTSHFQKLCEVVGITDYDEALADNLHRLARSTTRETTAFVGPPRLVAKKAGVNGEVLAPPRGVPRYRLFVEEGVMTMSDQPLGYVPTGEGEPLRDGTYWCTVADDCMWPRFSIGQRLLVDEYEPVTPFDGCIVRASAKGGEIHIREYIDSDEKFWHVRRYGKGHDHAPAMKTEKFERGKYPYCHLISSVHRR